METKWPLERKGESREACLAGAERGCEARRGPRQPLERKKLDREKTIYRSRNRGEGALSFFPFSSQKIRTSIVAVVLCFAPFVVRGRGCSRRRERERTRERKATPAALFLLFLLLSKSDMGEETKKMRERERDCLSLSNKLFASYFF